MTSPERRFTPPRKVVSDQEAERELSRVAYDARVAALALHAFLKKSAVPDAAVKSLALRSRSLLMKATECLDAAVELLEGDT